ncbi:MULTISPECIES: bestrophin family protein [unclassified Chitinophaga]|uniref:bestrophin family protein n=2 Tax=Chitinophaga TaxID=79328 RepID=UPI00300FF4D3
MHEGKSYKFGEFLFWTRRKIYILMVISIVPVILYETCGLEWISIPWTVVALLGTATAFTVGFKNTQTYNRTNEAQQVWTSIVSLSRSWGIFSRDFFSNTATTRELIYRHMAWLTALRYEMRTPRTWETIDRKHNTEYQRFYRVAERETPLNKELAKYLSGQELKEVLAASNTAARILANQGKLLRKSFDEQQMQIAQFLEMEKGLKEFYISQAKSEQVKNSPYPRQYAVVNSFFIRIFCLLLPFGLLRDFDKLNELVEGAVKGHMVWLVVPFSIMISWMYTSLEQIGESTENPFEGSANDVPLTSICRDIEIELRELLEEKDLPPKLYPQHNILL